MITAKSSKKASRDVANMRRDVTKTVSSHRISKSPLHHKSQSPLNSEGEQFEVENEAEEVSAVGVSVRNSPERRSTVKVLTAKSKDAIRRKSLLGQMEKFVERESILESIFSDSDSDNKCKGDGRILEIVSSSDESTGVIANDTLNSKHRTKSNINYDLRKKSRTRSDSDNSEEQVDESDVDRRDVRDQQKRRQRFNGNTKLSEDQDHGSELSDMSVGGRDTDEGGGIVISVTKRLSSQTVTDKGPMHRPFSSTSSFTSTSSSQLFLSPHGAVPVLPHRKSPIEYSQDAVLRKPASSLPIPLISSSLKTFDNPLGGINASRRGSINRKVPLQALHTAQPFLGGSALIGHTQGKKPQPQPQHPLESESDLEPDSTDIEAMPLDDLKSPKKMNPSLAINKNAVHSIRVSREEKKKRNQDLSKRLRQYRDSMRGARSPSADSVTSDSSRSPDTATAAKGAEGRSSSASPSKKRRQEENEVSESSIDGIEESEEQKRLRRVAACEMLLLNRRSSGVTGNSTHADVAQRQRAEKRKHREGEGSFTQEGKKRGRPQGSIGLKKRAEGQYLGGVIKSEFANTVKKTSSSSHSTRQSTGGKEPRHSTDSEPLKRVSQGSEFRARSVTHGYGAGIGLSSLSSMDMGAHAKTVNGVSRSALASPGKTRPVPAASTSNTQASLDRRNFTSSTSKRDSSSSSSSSSNSNNIYSKTYNDRGRSRTLDSGDVSLRNDRGSGSAVPSRSRSTGEQSSDIESVLV